MLCGLSGSFELFGLFGLFASCVSCGSCVSCWSNDVVDLLVVVPLGQMMLVICLLVSHFVR